MVELDSEMSNGHHEYILSKKRMEKIRTNLDKEAQLDSKRSARPNSLHHGFRATSRPSLNQIHRI
jgi:hypothetical protein